MTINLDEIEKALEDLSESRNQLHFHINAPEWLRLLVERVRKLESVIYDKYVEHQDYCECDCSICIIGRTIK